jgi:MoaA/NifB/PqqE/SkfB family radical SAM enzyme
MYVAEEFSKYSDKMTVNSWYREPDYRDDYKELWELEQSLSTHPPQRFELCSIWRLARDKEYIKWLKSFDIKTYQLSFFGMEDTTDYYTGRKGAFKNLLYATELLLENGLLPRWQIFINQDNIDETSELLKLSKELKLDARCIELGGEFNMFAHQGSCDGENRKLYDIWLTDACIDKLPKELVEKSMKHSKCNTIQGFLGKTEKELYSELIEDSSTYNMVSKTPVFFVSADFDVYPNYSEASPWFKLGNLKTDGIDVIMNNYINNKSIAQNIRSTVPIKDLVKKCGNPISNKLFTKGDYIGYVLNEYCE